MKDTGILQVLKKNTGVYAHILNFMIIARLLEPSSDLSLINLLERVYYPWSGVDLNDDYIYQTPDKLISVKDEIEISIFKTLKPDTSMVHYDLTSSYFEGKENNDLVLFGYSRDKKRGKNRLLSVSSWQMEYRYTMKSFPGTPWIRRRLNQPYLH